VIIAYLQVLNNEDLVAVARQQVEAARKQVERLEILNRQGAITPSQLYELSGQMKENELAVINSQNAVESAKLAWLQLMNQPYDTNIRLERVDAASMLQAPAETATAVYTKALDRLATIRAADQRQKSADAALKAARGAMYPTLLFSGNLNTNYSSIATRDILLNTTEVPTSNYVVVNGSQLPVFVKRDQYALERIRYGNQLESNLFSNIGLTLRLPLFNSFQSRNRIRLAQIDYKSAQLIGESVRVEVRQQVEQAHLNAVNAWNRYNVLTQQVDFFKEAFRIAEVRFNAGVGNSIDYVLAKTNYDRANLNLVMAKYDYLFRRQVLSFYTGEK
jgi:outer membrane protein